MLQLERLSRKKRQMSCGSEPTLLGKELGLAKKKGPFHGLMSAKVDLSVASFQSACRAAFRAKEHSLLMRASLALHAVEVGDDAHKERRWRGDGSLAQ